MHNCTQLTGQIRRERNRKRSKRRAIFCPIHRCYLDSVSQKYRLFADRAGQLMQRCKARVGETPCSLAASLLFSPPPTPHTPHPVYFLALLSPPQLLSATECGCFDCFHSPERDIAFLK
ncbi:MAG: hypothetical protein F6J90_42290 [Moorea sp. SIOASIH]|nr:hypothetical protein [Moorena sp. SIOASIH]